MASLSQARTERLATWTLVALAASLALAGLSLALPSFQTEDPWSWIVWGREVAHLSLNTRGGPSWKPLPVLFTTVLAPLGGLAPSLWLCIARAGGVFALALAYRLAKRFAGVAAGIVAAAALFFAPDWLRYMAHGTSEPLMAALVLWAIELHLCRRPGPAFICAVGAALARPEAWPFVFCYGLYLVACHRRLRVLVAAGFCLIPVMWFGADFWGSGNPIHGAQTAHSASDSIAHTALPALVLIERAGLLVQPAVAVLALVCVIAALRRESGVELVIAAGAAMWFVLVAAMTMAGYPGDTRYIVPATAVACVLGGIGAVRLAATARPGLKRTAVWTLVAAAVVAAWIPNARNIRAHAAAQTANARLYSDLVRASTLTVGARRVTALGSPTIAPAAVKWLKPALAWHLNLPLAAVHGPENDQPISTQAVVFWHTPRRPTDPVSYLSRVTRAEPQLVAGNGTWQVFVFKPGLGATSKGG